MRIRTTHLVVIALLAAALACAQPPPDDTPAPSTPLPTPPPIILEKFDSRFVEIWLPDTFVGGDPQLVDLEMITDEIHGLNPRALQVARLVERLPHLYSILAIDTNIGEYDIPHMVFVVREYLREEFVLQEMMDYELSRYTGYMTVVSSDVVQVGEHEAVRFVLEEITDEAPASKQLVYAIKDGNNVWSINFSTSVEEFGLRSPAFEKSISTFAVKPETPR